MRSSPGPKPFVVWAMLLLLLPSLAGVLAQAEPDVQVMGSMLPRGRSQASAIWDGTSVLVFGGVTSDGYTSDILRYNPATDPILSAGSLPTPRLGTMAVWTGDAVFVMGGFELVDGVGARLDQIVRYDPATATTTVMAGRLPTPLTHAGGGVWTGQHVFLFGGVTGLSPPVSSDILRYDVETDTLNIMQAKLPKSSYGHGVVWDGRHAYLLGGWHNDGGTSQRLDHILRYDPESDVIETLPARLPTPRMTHHSAALVGSVIYLAGGYDGGDLDEIVSFDPATGEVAVSARLPSPRQYAMAASDGRALYVLGGAAQTRHLSDIIRYVPDHEPVPLIAPVPVTECLDGRATVRLDGSASFDPDGNPLSFAWSAPGIAFDDAAARQPTASFPLGATPVTLTVSDGRHTASARVEVLVADTLPPSTSARLEGVAGDAGWWRSAVGLTLDAVDLCGIASTRLSVDSGPWQEGAAALFAGDGSHVAVFRSTDLGGHEEPLQAVALRIDATPPVAALVEPREGTVYVFDVPVEVRVRAGPVGAMAPTTVVGDKTVHVEASDATSGMARVEFWLDATLLHQDEEAPFRFTWAAGEHGLGPHVLEARAWDRAGNVAVQPLEVRTVPMTPEAIEETLDRLGDGPNLPRDFLSTA